MAVDRVFTDRAPRRVLKRCDVRCINVGKLFPSDWTELEALYMTGDWDALDFMYSVTAQAECDINLDIHLSKHEVCSCIMCRRDDFNTGNDGAADSVPVCFACGDDLPQSMQIVRAMADDDAVLGRPNLFNYSPETCMMCDACYDVASANGVCSACKLPIPVPLTDTTSFLCRGRRPSRQRQCA